MAYTLDDLRRLEKAMSSGVLEVKYADKTQRYHSLAEMRTQRAFMLKELGPTPPHKAGIFGGRRLVITPGDGLGGETFTNQKFKTKKESIPNTSLNSQEDEIVPRTMHIIFDTATQSLPVTTSVLTMVDMAITTVNKQLITDADDYDTLSFMLGIGRDATDGNRLYFKENFYVFQFKRMLPIALDSTDLRIPFDVDGVSQGRFAFGVQTERSASTFLLGQVSFARQPDNGIFISRPTVGLFVRDVQIVLIKG